MGTKHVYKRGPNIKFCAVYLVDNRKIGRSAALKFDKAYALVRKYNDKNKGSGKRSYFEEAVSVKHLPILEKP